VSAPVPNTTLSRLDALRRRLTPRSYTGRAVLGTVAAMAIGLSFGGAARALKSSPPQPSLSITATADTTAPKPTTVSGAIAASAQRSAVGVLAQRFSGSASDIAAEWRGTDVRYEARQVLREAQHDPALGARLAGIAAGALVVVLAIVLGTFVGVRALLRRRVARAESAPVEKKATRFTLPRPKLALRARLASLSRRRTTPAAPVIALAAAGTNPAEIARRTGLSRDAIALALNCSRMA
jgi:hypothetical protein